VYNHAICWLFVSLLSSPSFFLLNTCNKFSTLSRHLWHMLPLPNLQTGEVAALFFTHVHPGSQHPPPDKSLFQCLLCRCYFYPFQLCISSHRGTCFIFFLNVVTLIPLGWRLSFNGKIPTVTKLAAFDDQWLRMLQ